MNLLKKKVKKDKSNKDKLNLYKCVTINTAYSYINGRNKSKVSKAEWDMLDNSIKNLYIAYYFKDLEKNIIEKNIIEKNIIEKNIIEQEIALKNFISIDTKIKLKLIS